MMSALVMARDNLLENSPNCWEPGSNSFNAFARLGNAEDREKKSRHVPNEKATKLTTPWIYVVGCYAAPGQWLINPNTLKVEDDYLLKLLPESVADGIRNGSGWLLLYCGLEGINAAGSHLFESLHTSLRYRDIPANKTIFITANFFHEDFYQQWCDSRSISDRMHTIATDTWEYMTSMFMHGRKQEYFSVAGNPYTAMRENYYLCYNRRIHSHRIAVCMYLQQQKLLSKGLVSFPSPEVAEGGASGFIPLSHPWWSASQEELVMFTDESKWRDFMNELPLFVDVQTMKNNLASNYTSWPYEKTYFSLVNETFLNGGSLFLSEKTYKPMVHCHPFIVIGSRHTLRKLREDGYKTFDLDESYDEERDPFRRMMMALEQVQKLCDMPLFQLHKWYWNQRDILVHNQNHLRNRVTAISHIYQDLGKIIGLV